MRCGGDMMHPQNLPGEISSHAETKPVPTSNYAYSQTTVKHANNNNYLEFNESAWWKEYGIPSRETKNGRIFGDTWAPRDA